MDKNEIFPDINPDEINVEEIEKYFRDKGLDLEAGILRIKNMVENHKKRIEEEEKKKEEEEKAEETNKKGLIKKAGK